MGINLFGSQEMSIEEFVAMHREFIDAEVNKAYPCDKELTDEERKEWVYADEDIYLFAKSAGVRL